MWAGHSGHNVTTDAVGQDSSPAAGVHARLQLFNEFRKADVDAGRRTRVRTGVLPHAI